MRKQNKFKVYPKNGKMFILICERFEARENSFVLYDWGNLESNEGILCFTEIAAIIPETQREGGQATPLIHFSVYLKDSFRLRDNEEQIEVLAHAFKIDQESGIAFFGQERGAEDKVINEWPIEGIYIALSELIAIIPSDGLQRRGWR